MEMTVDSEVLEGKLPQTSKVEKQELKKIKRSEKRIGEENLAYADGELAYASASVAYDGSAQVAVNGGVDYVDASVDVIEAKPAKKRKGLRYGCYIFLKRAFDMISSGLVLLVLSWLIVLLIFIKWLEDLRCPAYMLQITEVEDDGKKHSDRITRADGKIFECKLCPDKKNKKNVKRCSPVYISKRVGKDGKEFNFHKIRSMCSGAEDMKDMLIEAGLNEADPPAFKMKRDPRITKFGRFLRKTSLDELPQLWDIFVGKMSVVGPRPPIPCEVAQYSEEQMHRLDVKGGLLCLWQVQKDRNKISFEDWVKLDLEYIEKRSVWLDLKIIFKGLYMVIFDRSGE
jgi:lipopolysaccharide/colanic/teichoic acid biosynthesis glycosyltransferase